MARYNKPTVDVDLATLRIIWNSRPDIGALFSPQLRSDGTPWVRNVADPTDREKIDILTHWWTTVAGFDDNPVLFGYSLAEWTSNRLHIRPNVVGQSPQTGGPISVGGEKTPMALGILVTALVVMLLTQGGKQSARLQFAPVGGAGLGMAAPKSRSRKI